MRRSRRGNRRGVHWYTVAILLISLALVMGGSSSSAGAPGSLTKIRYAVASRSVGANSLHLLIGEYLGYYKEEGLTIEYQTLGSYGVSEAALASGRAELGISSFQQQLLEFGQDQGPIGVAFYEFAYPNKYDFAVLEGSPVKSAKELEGKRVGINELGQGTGAMPMALRWLEIGGVDPEKVTWVPVGLDYGPQAAAWKAGRIDALFSEDSAWGTIESVGLKFRFLPRPARFPKIGGLMVGARREYMDKNRAVIEGFGRVSCKGTNFVMENPKAAAWIFLQMYPQAGSPGKSVPEQVEAIYKSIEYRAIRRDGYRSWAPATRNVCGWIPLEEFNNEVEWWGTGGKVADPKKFYTNEFSQAINRFDKEAIRKQAREFKWPK